MFHVGNIYIYICSPRETYMYTCVYICVYVCILYMFHVGNMHLLSDFSSLHTSLGQDYVDNKQRKICGISLNNAA